MVVLGIIYNAKYHQRTAVTCNVSSPASIQRPGTRSRKQARKRSDPLQDLGRRVTAKIEEGDLREAIRLASSDELLADFSDDTFNALKAKHPPAHPDSDIPPCPVTNQPAEFEITEGDVLHAIKSFPCGSAGGPEKLRPQHLKDLL